MSNPSYIVAIISPERRVHEHIATSLEGYPFAESLWALSDYPDARQLGAIKDLPGCVVLLDFCDPLRAKAVAAELDRGYPMAATVALNPGNGQQDLLELMQLGIREVLNAPIAGPEIARAVTRAGKKLQRESEAVASGGHVFAFMPAKPGSGSTTIATHVSAAVARLTNQRILLADFDLRLGMTSFLFKLHNEHSVQDALVSAHTLDITRWDRLVGRRGMLDILGSAPAEFGRDIPESGATHVLDFAATLYSTLLVDLPGDMRDYELEILQRAREIFLICTPEIGALHMAKKKTDMLRQLDLANKVSVIMNRSGGRASMPIGDIEKVLLVPVRFSVESAEKEVREATQQGAAIEGKSPVATQLENIARHIMPGDAPVEDRIAKRRFIDFFSVTPVRDKVNWKR